MESENLKDDKLRKKAEEVLQNQLHPIIKDQFKDELIQELRTHQIELELQNEELRESQLKLEDSQRKYWELYDFSPIGYLTLDEEGIIKEINLLGASLLKHPRKDLIRSPFFVFLTPESRNKFHQHIKNVINTGIDQDCDLELIRTDQKPINIHIKTSYTDNESITHFKIALLNISQTKQTEDLNESLKRFGQVNHTLVALRHSSLAMMHAADEVSYLDDVCKIIVNDCGYSLVWIGFTEKEDKKVQPAVYAGFEEDYLKTLDITWDDTERGHGPTGTAIRSGEICICENMLTDPKFNPWREEAVKRGYASSIVLPLINDNKAFGALSIYSKETNPFSEAEKKLLKELADDISYGITSIRLRTEHEKNEKALQESLIEVERSNSELEQFAYITSHDLREPLRMITSFLQLLERRYSDQLDEDANDFIGFAVDGAKRLDAMINDILIYSRVANKERDLTGVNFNKVLEQVYVNLAASVEETEAEITYDILPEIITDERLMIQLFQNLIGNAIKYRSEITPNIHISAINDGNKYIFSVKDNGIGIDPKHLDNIFTIFQRLHTHDEYEGTGIGLSIAQKIVNQHGGEIWAESELGKGTIFYFTLPNRDD